MSLSIQKLQESLNWHDSPDAGFPPPEELLARRRCWDDGGDCTVDVRTADDCSERILS